MLSGCADKTQQITRDYLIQKVESYAENYIAEYKKEEPIVIDGQEFDFEAAFEYGNQFFNKDWNKYGECMNAIKSSLSKDSARLAAIYSNYVEAVNAVSDYDKTDAFEYKTAVSGALISREVAKDVTKLIKDINTDTDLLKIIGDIAPIELSTYNFYGAIKIENAEDKNKYFNDFGEGFYFATVEEELTPSYGVKINGKISTAKSNPIITLTLENTIAAVVITPGMVQLSGALSELEVTHVSGNANSIVIATSGQVTGRDTLTGTVELSTDATKSGETLVAHTQIDSISAWVNESSYKLTGNNLSFDIILGGDKFTDGVTNFSAAGTQFEVVSFSNDRSTATVKTQVTATVLDDAIVEIKGKVLTVEPGQVTSGERKEIVLTASSAEIIMAIDYVEKIDTSTYEATAVLFVQNGKFEELATTDLMVEGDFYGATIEKLRQHGDRYSVLFRFSKSDIDIEDCLLFGELRVSSGKIKNNWNTASEKLSCEVSYSAGHDKGEVGAIAAFVAANASTFDTLSTIGSGIGGVASAASGIITVLELCGVLESTNDKLDSIRREINIAQDMITNLSSKVDALGRTLTGSQDTIISQNYKTIYNTAAANWNNFLAEYVMPLENVLSDYEMEYKKYMLNYFNSASTEAKTIYIDNDNRVNLPHPNIGGQTVDGKKIKSSNSYKLKTELTNMKGAIAANRGKLPNKYWEDFSAYLKAKNGEILDGVSGVASNITVTDYLQAVQVNAANAAMQAVTPKKILNVYKNFCYKLAGSVGGSPASPSVMTPLDYYYQMLSVFYNFYSESKMDMEQTQAWLYSFIAESSGIATMALNFTPEATEKVVMKGYSLAQKELSANTGAKPVKSGSQYSYVAGDMMNAEYARTFVDITQYGELAILRPAGALNEYKFPSKFVTADMLATMRNRYSVLKSAGVTPTADFGQYMFAKGLVAANNVNDFVLTERPWKEVIPLDNSVTLTCTWINNRKMKYLALGNSYSIGTSGKLSAEYWTAHFMLKGAAQTLDGSQTTTMLAAYCKYSENHWYWSIWEWAYFLLNRNVTIFALGK